MIARFGTALATAALVALPGAANASPYKITGLDAATSLELKLFTKLKSNHWGSELEGPGFDLTIPVAGGLEASATFGPGRLHETGGRTRWGMIDSEFAMKWEIVSMPDDGGIGLTTEPAVIAPTGTHGLGDDEWRFEAPLVIGWASGRVEVRGEAGYERGLKSHEDEVSFGVVTEYDLSDSFSIGAEVTGSTPSLAFRSYEAAADIGFKWEFARSVELQGRLGRSLRRDDRRPQTEAALYVEIAF
ncbi:MAG TPA: transporter [Sphingomonas sp.]|nr:transporter [Sphingomonas sp.]